MPFACGPNGTARTLCAMLDSTLAYLPDLLVFSVLGLLLMHLMVGLFLMNHLSGSTDPTHSAEAVFGYTAQAFGIVLMSIGGIPALYGVLAERSLPVVAYLGLLLVFAIGGLLFMWQDTALRSLPKASTIIPASLSHVLWRFVGLLVMTVSLLSFLLQLLVDTPTLERSFWALHLTGMFYGMLLLLATRPVQPPRSAISRLVQAAKPKPKRRK